MFIMSVNIDCYLEDPRLFKTHQGAIEAMFSILDGYAYSCCGYSSDNVRNEVRAIKESIDSGADAVGKEQGKVEAQGSTSQDYGAACAVQEKDRLRPQEA